MFSNTPKKIEITFSNEVQSRLTNGEITAIKRLAELVASGYSNAVFQNFQFELFSHTSEFLKKISLVPFNYHFTEKNKVKTFNGVNLLQFTALKNSKGDTITGLMEYANLSNEEINACITDSTSFFYGKNALDIAMETINRNAVIAALKSKNARTSLQLRQSQTNNNSTVATQNQMDDAINEVSDDKNINFTANVNISQTNINQIYDEPSQAKSNSYDVDSIVVFTSSLVQSGNDNTKELKFDSMADENNNIAVPKSPLIKSGTESIKEAKLDLMVDENNDVAVSSSPSTKTESENINISKIDLMADDTNNIVVPTSPLIKSEYENVNEAKIENTQSICNNNSLLTIRIPRVQQRSTFLPALIPDLLSAEYTESNKTQTLLALFHFFNKIEDLLRCPLSRSVVTNPYILRADTNGLVQDYEYLSRQRKRQTIYRQRISDDTLVPCMATREILAILGANVPAITKTEVDVSLKSDILIGTLDLISLRPMIPGNYGPQFIINRAAIETPNIDAKSLTAEQWNTDNNNGIRSIAAIYKVLLKLDSDIFYKLNNKNDYYPKCIAEIKEDIVVQPEIPENQDNLFSSKIYEIILDEPVSEYENAINRLSDQEKQGAISYLNDYKNKLQQLIINPETGANYQDPVRVYSSDQPLIGKVIDRQQINDPIRAMLALPCEKTRGLLELFSCPLQLQKSTLPTNITAQQMKSLINGYDNNPGVFFIDLSRILGYAVVNYNLSRYGTNNSNIIAGIFGIFSAKNQIELFNKIVPKEVIQTQQVSDEEKLSDNNVINTIDEIVENINEDENINEEENVIEENDSTCDEDLLETDIPMQSEEKLESSNHNNNNSTSTFLSLLSSNEITIKPEATSQLMDTQSNNNTVSTITEVKNNDQEKIQPKFMQYPAFRYFPFESTLNTVTKNFLDKAERWHHARFKEELDRARLAIFSFYQDADEAKRTYSLFLQNLVNKIVFKYEINKFENPIVSDLLENLILQTPEFFTPTKENNKSIQVLVLNQTLRTVASSVIRSGYFHLGLQILKKLIATVGKDSPAVINYIKNVSAVKTHLLHDIILSNCPEPIAIEFIQLTKSILGGVNSKDFRAYLQPFEGQSKSVLKLAEHRKKSYAKYLTAEPTKVPAVESKQGSLQFYGLEELLKSYDKQLINKIETLSHDILNPRNDNKSFTEFKAKIFQPMETELKSFVKHSKWSQEKFALHHSLLYQYLLNALMFRFNKDKVKTLRVINKILEDKNLFYVNTKNSAGILLDKGFSFFNKIFFNLPLDVSIDFLETFMKKNNLFKTASVKEIFLAPFTKKGGNLASRLFTAPDIKHFRDLLSLAKKSLDDKSYDAFINHVDDLGETVLDRAIKNNLPSIFISLLKNFDGRTARPQNNNNISVSDNNSRKRPLESPPRQTTTVTIPQVQQPVVMQQPVNYYPQVGNFYPLPSIPMHSLYPAYQPMPTFIPQVSVFNSHPKMFYPNYTGITYPAQVNNNNATVSPEVPTADNNKRPKISNNNNTFFANSAATTDAYFGLMNDAIENMVNYIKNFENHSTFKDNLKGFLQVFRKNLKQSSLWETYKVKDSMSAELIIQIEDMLKTLIEIPEMFFDSFKNLIKLTIREEDKAIYAELFCILGLTITSKSTTGDKRHLTFCLGNFSHTQSGRFALLAAKELGSVIAANLLHKEQARHSLANRNN